MASLLDIAMMQNPVARGLLGPQQDAQQATGGSPLPPAQGPVLPSGGPVQAPQGLLAAAQAGQGGPAAGSGAPAGPDAQQAAQAAQAQAQAQQQRLQEMFQQVGAIVQQPKRERMKVDARETLLTTGLALLAGGPDVTFGQALATGVMAGRQAAAASDAARAAETAAQQRAQQYLSVLGEGPLTRDRIDNAIKVATISQDTDTLRVLKDIRGQMPDDEKAKLTPKEYGDTLVFTDDQGNVFDADRKRLTAEQIGLLGQDDDMSGWQVKDRGGEFFFINPNTQEIRNSQGETVTDLPEMTTGDRVKPIKRKRLDEAGNEIEFMADPFTGQPIPGSDQVVGRPKSESSGFGDILQRELTNVREIIGDDPGTTEVEGADQFRALTGRFGTLAQKLPNRMKSADVQKLNSAVGNIVSLVIRDRSGTQASDAEVERLLQVVAPQAGDSAETVRAKLRRIEQMIQTTVTDGPNAATDPLMRVGDVISEFEALGGR